jgi:hypothetical protein
VGWTDHSGKNQEPHWLIIERQMNWLKQVELHIHPNYALAHGSMALSG